VNRISYFLCVAALSVLSAPALAGDTPSPAADPKLDLAITLMHESGVADQIASAVDRNLHDDIAKQKRIHSEVPDSFWDAYNSAFHGYYRAHEDELIRKVAQVYASRLSEAELQAAIAFYETPSGKKLADASLPNEIGEVVEQWGDESSSAVTAKVQNSMGGRQ